MNPIDNDFYISSGKATLTAVSCYTTALCVAVDGQGDVLAGERRTSAGATPTTIGGSAGDGSENPATPTMPTNTPAPGPTAGSPVAPTPAATSVEAGLAALLALLHTHIDRHPPSAAAPIEISFAAPRPGVLVVEILANVNGKQRRVAVLTARFGAAKNRRLTLQLTNTSGPSPDSHATARSADDDSHFYATRPDRDQAQFDSPGQSRRRGSTDVAGAQRLRESVAPSWIAFASRTTPLSDHGCRLAGKPAKHDL